ncbi:cell surface protein SprA [Fulvivirgaceae bacterium PWU20]|uniref:Cell surface protein SprA n=1 Tax=Chryseosolibacter indicus TaxID=2782351 RepID=A0ABS5VTF7_9BACT|nr:cell surface protein SprA [Chryseosolibacter indicus]
MKKNCNALSLGLVTWLVCLFSFESYSQRQDSTRVTRQDTSGVYKPSKRPTYRPTDRYGDPFSNSTTASPLFLKDPNQMKLDVEIDTALNYTVYEKIGDLNYRPTTSMSFSEFQQYQDRKILKDYWQSKARAMDGESAVAGRGFTPKIFVSPVLDRIFGGSYVELQPRGFVTLDFGGSFQRIANPNIPARQQRNGGFEFDQQINMSVVGKVGEKLAVTANFDNNNSFDFQNNMKVEYTGFKEDILQKLEIGNVSLPLNNTLIQGAQNLFGIKAQMQFGKLNVTTIASTQRGKVSSIDIPGGNNGQGRPFEIVASNYDENRHFFLGHFFRDNYRKWTKNSPQITSGVNITRVEVYILNRNNDTQTLRNVVGLMDLGEPTRIHNATVISSQTTLANSNEANSLFQYVTTQLGGRNADAINGQLDSYFAGEVNNGTDYEKITSARRLNDTEFTFHRQLGYITLTRKLQNDEALAVAYEFTYNGRPYKVGELSEDYASRGDQEVIFLKLLRPRRINIRDERKRIIPTWDLMMKNIYSLNVNQLSRENFQLRIIYRDDRSGIDNPQFQEGSAEMRQKQLVEIFGLDLLNPVNDRQRDGNFDFVEGVTVNTESGLIIFPYLEPFSEALREEFNRPYNTQFRDQLIQKYSYDTLYRTTKAEAELFATKNKFMLVGQYNAGSAREILIPGFGVSQGSVKIFAGGMPLSEGTDYSVDYTFGKVTILNESILTSGKNISVQYEQSDPFAFQTRSLVGSRFDYKLNDDVNFGSTILYYNERPLISRNQVGTEPARNLQYGLDFNIQKNSRFLTKMIDALPIIQTKEQSSFAISGEFAQLLPGTSNVINGEGTAYIDDFENSATPISLMTPLAWRLSSTPVHDSRFYPGGVISKDRSAGHKRAKLAWYQIDNMVYRDGGPNRPANISQKDIENHYIRPVDPQEIFPYYNRQQGNFYQSIFDLAYYPDERGPYNYNNIDFNKTTGKLANPRDNWAGITTAIKNEVDFDKANIEYIEFWMLDPFIEGENGKIYLRGKEQWTHQQSGGQVLFQLGNISEDVIIDSKHGFENGLPPTGVNNPGQVSVQRTEWGYVTNEQFLNNAFDNSPNARTNQDVGLDGISSEQERSFFTEFSDLTDPSGDDFRFYLDETYDNTNAQLLERYKNINGMDGNSPIIGNDRIARSGTQTPDNEDINVDNTLNELEEYYEYAFDLKKSNLEAGKGYIVDQITTRPSFPDGSNELVTWYLVRIPIRGRKSIVGNMSGFKSIRYMRMILTGFQEPVVLRLANFRFVGSKWRKYNEDLRTGLNPDIEPNDDFTVSVVNLEENGFKNEGEQTPLSAYTIPPGVVRDRDNTSSVARQLNEQSVQVCVDELKDGDARAIYKTSGFDLFNYGKIKMYLHANSLAPDNELHAFLRLGTDFDQNYYEIEIPLKISDPNNTDARAVWPEENEIDLDLNELYALKASRDREQFPTGESYPREGPKAVGKHLIRIFGRPDMSSIQVMMIGVRNPRSEDNRSYSACIWANELRVTDFDRTAGWAATTTVNAKLADFATLTGALRYTTYGFGSVSSKIGERTRDETTAYDISANVNVDKLLPGNTGIKIPMFVSYENTTVNPNYDPANPDMRLEAALKSLPTQEDRENFKKLIQDKTTRRSLNFVNVRKTKVKQDARTHIYDIENLSFSYSYSEANQTNFLTQESTLKQYRGSVAYNFAPKATGIEPFKNSSAFNSPYLKFIKEFNFSLLPTSISIRGDLDRSFSKKVYRNSTGAYGSFVLSPPNYLKYFTFNRQYNVRWALSKGLTLEYTSRANAIIDEPEGDISTRENRDSVMYNLKRFGRMKNFDQMVTLNYTVPFDKFPVTDWLGAEYRFQASYNWKAGPINALPDDVAESRGIVDDLPDEFDFKNTIQNSRDNNVSGKIDFVKLYNKVKFLKDLNTPPRPASTRPQSGRPVPTRPAAPDTVKTTPQFVKGFLRLLMSLRSINATYTLTEGTILPGFTPTPKLFGMDKDWNAPGWDFILGSQNPNIRKRAAENGWLTNLPELTTPFAQVKDENISIRANIEPSSEFKIQLDIKKETSTSYQEIFRFDPSNKFADETGFASLNPTRSGSYRISFLSIKTAFDGSNDDTESAVFSKFEENLDIIRNRFSIAHGGKEFDSTNQDIVIPAFIAAYSGKNARAVSLSPFPSTPLPNWRVDYTGLSKMDIFKDIFQSVTISHGYQSSYSVMNYTNSLVISDPSKVSVNRPIEDYNVDYLGEVDATGRYVPIYVISQVMISEQFAPLVGINVRTKRRLTARAEYKTKRDLALNISNAQITELNSKDVSFELGYTKNNMKLPFKSQGRTIVLKNDVTFRMNVTITNSKTIQRKVDELNTITNGNINFQLRPNISYVVNQKLTLQGYFERTINEPVVTTSFRRTTTRFGVQVRFSLAQ